MLFFKFSIVLAGYLVWLRSVRLCADDLDDLEVNAGPHFLALLYSGFAGIIAAILLPAWGVGAGVVAATCGIPTWRYVRWRNSQVGELELRVDWKRFLTLRRRIVREEPDVEFVMPFSGEVSSEMASSIAFVGRSFSQGTIESTFTPESHRTSGLQSAITLLSEAISRHATDIHIATKDDSVRIRLRIDGLIVPLQSLPLAPGVSLINVFKVLGELDIADKKRSQDGSFRVDVNDRRLCLRLASQGTDLGESLSIRILDPAASLATFDALGLNEQMSGRLQALLNRSNGLILFSGPTGAGKSTTAYAALRRLDSGERNIVTIEDPIEYRIPSIDQIEVKARTGLTFQAALRSVLRQDADVVLVGEIRDEETAKIACQAATTGQLVLTTLHATDAIGAVYRLIDLKVDPYNVASAIRGSISQLLARRLCQECRVETALGEAECRRIGIKEGTTGLYASPDPSKNSCLHCNGTGHFRRTGIFGLLDATVSIRDLIRDSAGAGAVAAAAREFGMTTIRDNAMRLLLEGAISPAEFSRLIDED